MSQKPLKIILFEDDPEYRAELPQLFKERLGDKGVVVLMLLWMKFTRKDLQRS